MASNQTDLIMVLIETRTDRNLAFSKANTRQTSAVRPAGGTSKVAYLDAFAFQTLQNSEPVLKSP